MHYLVLIIVLLVTGCATNTGDETKDRRGRVTNAVLENIAKAVGQVALSTLTNAATQQLNGNKVDLAQAASEGLWKNAGTIVDSNSLTNVINAWSGGAIKPVAAVAAQKFEEAKPVTPAEKAAVVNTIAASISKAAEVKP